MPRTYIVHVEILGTLPLALVFAVVNAAQEEVRSRPSSRWSAQATPFWSRPPSASATTADTPRARWASFGGTLVGWLWGRALLDTRGLAIPWVSHGVQDPITYLTGAVVRR